MQRLSLLTITMFWTSMVFGAWPLVEPFSRSFQIDPGAERIEINMPSGPVDGSGGHLFWCRGGLDHLDWTSKYGSVVISAYEIATPEGLNEAGMAGNLLYLAESDFGDPASPWTLDFLQLSCQLTIMCKRRTVALFLPLTAVTVYVLSYLAPSERVLPAPSGPCSVGRTVFRWIDTDRLEVLSAKPGDKREVAIWVWYPV